MIKGALEDSFEKLVEQGATKAKKTVKSAVKQVASTVSPNKMWEELLGVSSGTSEVKEERSDGRTSEVKRGGNHTPLNLEKLGKNYQDQAAQKSEALKQHLFRMVKRGEEQILEEGKKEKEEKKRKELYEVQEKKRKEQERLRQEQSAEMPKGKVRRSIFSHKKVAERQHAELKPSSGKQ